MNSRERVFQAMNYESPDRIPVFYGWANQAGLYTHGQKLLDLYRELPPDNSFLYDSIPEPALGTMDAEGNYCFSERDAWGTLWEYRKFGIVGHPKAYPFKSWEEGVEKPMPPVPESGDADGERKKIESERNDYCVIRGWISIFEKLHAIQPMEDVLMDLISEEDDFMDYLRRMVDYQKDVIRFYIDSGADVIQFADDWGSQLGPIVSPNLFNEIYKPLYKEMFDLVHDAGKKVFFHCCGVIGPILDELMDLNIDGLWPQIAEYDLDSLSGRLKEINAMLYVHPDRQRLVPRDTPAEIDKQIRLYCEHFKKLGGGAVFNVEMEDDAPWENVETLIRSIHRYR